MTELLARARYERQESDASGYRNGCKHRDLNAGEGPIEIALPPGTRHQRPAKPREKEATIVAEIRPPC